MRNIINSCTFKIFSAEISLPLYAIIILTLIKQAKGKRSDALDARRIFTTIGANDVSATRLLSFIITNIPKTHAVLIFIVYPIRSKC